MIFNRRDKKSSIKVEVHINYGGDRIRRDQVSIHPGTSVLDVLAKVADIQYTPDESATGHCGAMVTAIDGFKNDRTHSWMYYLREDGESGWRLPMDTPDAVKIAKKARIAWRYHESPGRASDRSGVQRYGPLFSSRCISKIKRCDRKF